MRHTQFKAYIQLYFINYRNNQYQKDVYIAKQ